MALRTRVWSAGKLLLLCGALVATYVVFAAASMRMALRAREVQVPDLTNRTVKDATALANDLALAVRVDDSRRIDPRIAAGRVITQDPAPGATARAQRSVKVWVSAGARASLVPALNGQTQRSAELRLGQDGLEIGAISEIQSEKYASDIVVAQDPPPNTAGVRVELLVNRAGQAANYVMPDLIGVNAERAAAILRDHGFRVALTGAAPYAGVSPGIVLRQSPQAGSQVGPGDPVSIEVSR